MPNDNKYLIADRDASLAARQHTIVVTTLQIGAAATEQRGDTPERARFDSLNVVNLRTLKRHHVTIAIGTDNYRGTAVDEATYVQGLGVFTNGELLAIWSEATPHAIFPERKIGRLADGYEATFLALSGNPIADFSNTRRIVLLVKRGTVLAESGQGAGRE